MYEISVRTHFSAAHHLSGHPGKCAVHHGHNWEVEVYIRGNRLNDTGILVDFRHLKDAVEAVLSGVDHSDLNTLDAFKNGNPTSENIARYLHRTLSGSMNDDDVRVHRVCVHETPSTGASYWEE